MSLFSAMYGVRFPFRQFMKNFLLKPAHPASADFLLEPEDFSYGWRYEKSLPT